MTKCDLLTMAAQAIIVFTWANTKCRNGDRCGSRRQMEGSRECSGELAHCSGEFQWSKARRRASRRSCRTSSGFDNGTRCPMDLFLAGTHCFVGSIVDDGAAMNWQPLKLDHVPIFNIAMARFF